MPITEHGFVRSITDDKQIFVFTFLDNKQVTVDAWANYIIDYTQAWDNHRPFLILYDLRQIFLTPYIRKRGNEINSLSRPDLVGASALLLGDSLMARIMIRFIKRDMQTPSYHSLFEVFLKHDLALAWLYEQKVILEQVLQERAAGSRK